MPHPRCCGASRHSAPSLMSRYPKRADFSAIYRKLNCHTQGCSKARQGVRVAMKLHLAQLPKLIAERRSTAIFGVVIIAMLWGGICVKYVQDLRGDEREAERINRNFAMVLEENVLRSIGEIDKSLLYLRRTIETRQDATDFSTIVNT